MNRQTFSSPKSSPGFVYFNTSSNPADTPDFLSFSDKIQSPQANRLKSGSTNSPPHSNFSPGYSSSPVNFRRGSPSTPRNRQNNWHQRKSNRSGGHYGNNPWNHSSHNSTFNNSYSDNNRTSSVSSFDSSYQGQKRHSDGSEKRNIQRYIHPSFFEDPWAGLMRQVEEKWKQEEESQALKHTIEAVESESDKGGKSDLKSQETSGDESENGLDSDKESSESSDSSSSDVEDGKSGKCS